MEIMLGGTLFFQLLHPKPSPSQYKESPILPRFSVSGAFQMHSRIDNLCSPMYLKAQLQSIIQAETPSFA